MRIRQVHDGEALNEFIEFAWTINSSDPAWIPPLREQVFRELSGACAFSRYGRMQLLLCETGGRIAGRIAALVNPRLVEGDGTALGQLGYFECIDDTAVAGRLIGAGIDWLRLQGAQNVLAPMNGGAHKMHRFLTRGFERAPFLFEPRNLPYYATLFEQNGFAAVQRWSSYELSRKAAAARLKRFEAGLSRVPPPGPIEELAFERPEVMMSRIHRLLDPCWEGHIGYTSLDMEEFVEVFRGPLSIMSPGDISILVRDDMDMGFGLLYPDYAEPVRALAGQAEQWGKWLGGTLPKRGVVHTVALRPEIRGTSAAMAQLAALFRRGLADGFEELIVALVADGFLENIGDRTREYTLYSRSIARLELRS